MKRIVAVMLVCLMLALFAGCAEKESGLNTSDSETSQNAEEASKASEASQTADGEQASKKGTVNFAVSNSLEKTGLINHLLEEFEKESPYGVNVMYVSPSVAVAYAESGKADAILINSMSQVKKLVEDGYAASKGKKVFCENYIICGPENDPVNVGSMDCAREAFKAIADSEAGFVSTGDNGQINISELSVWEEAYVDPFEQTWYVSEKTDAQGALKKANKLGAYTVTDKYTFLLMKKSLKKLDIVMDKADDLKEEYSVIAVKSDVPAFKTGGIKINSKGAKSLIKWLFSDEAAQLIKAYGEERYGSVLFSTD